jgi:membrane-associated phospholipid phosphatase
MQIPGADLRIRRVILLFLLAILLIFGSWVLVSGKTISFRDLTGFHAAPANFFFRYLTHLGDGIFILLLAAVLALFRKYFVSVGIVAGYLLSGLFAQIGKRLVSAPRPKAFFEALGEKVYEVPGVNVHMSHSFPSGHTASVFALAVFLILALPYRWYSWLVLFAAILVGYSRIYLSQHFPSDVWAGAVIGSISGLVVFILLKGMAPKWQNT